MPHPRITLRLPLPAILWPIIIIALLVQRHLLLIPHSFLLTLALQTASHHPNKTFVSLKKRKTWQLLTLSMSVSSQLGWIWRTGDLTGGKESLFASQVHQSDVMKSMPLLSLMNN
jgi:hypothetical protein